MSHVTFSTGDADVPDSPDHTTTTTISFPMNTHTHYAIHQDSDSEEEDDEQQIEKQQNKEDEDNDHVTIQNNDNNNNNNQPVNVSHNLSQTTNIVTTTPTISSVYNSSNTTSSTTNNNNTNNNNTNNNHTIPFPLSSPSSSPSSSSSSTILPTPSPLSQQQTNNNKTWTRRMSLQAKHLSFPVYLKHQFPLITQQINNGLNNLKIFLKFLNNIYKLQSNYANDICKLVEYEKSSNKIEQYKLDEMKEHLNAMLMVHELYDVLGKRDELFAHTLQQTIIQPFNIWIPSIENKLDKIIKNEKYIAETISTLKKEHEKLKKDTMKLWMELNDIKKLKEKEIEKDGKINEKTYKKLNKYKDICKKEFIKYELLDEQLVLKVQEYRTTLLPSYLHELESIERERLSLLYSSLKNFNHALCQYQEPWNMMTIVTDNIKQLCNSSDMNQCIDHWLSIHGLPPADSSPSDPLPVKSFTFDNDTWENYGNNNNNNNNDKNNNNNIDGEGNSDDDDDDEDADTLSSSISNTIKNEWVIALQDSNTPYLTFKADDVICITSKNTNNNNNNNNNSSEPIVYTGYVVSDITHTQGTFLKSSVRGINEKVDKNNNNNNKDSKDDDEKNNEDNDNAATNNNTNTSDVSGQTTSVLADFVRGKVSKKKRRFQEDGFDLDLSYILPNLIAMGFPSEGSEALYRNPLKEVQRFFNKRHPNAYKLYNLCSERSYEHSKFDHRVSRYGFDDHNPCHFDMIQSIMEDIHQQCSTPGHVAAVHCKAGKGRTGFIICCYLLYSKLFNEAEEALKYYAIKRTKNQKGVTIPSQIRYVHYYNRYLQSLKPNSSIIILDSNPLLLSTIRLHNIPKIVSNGNKDIYFKIIQSDGSKYNSKSSKIKMDTRVAENYCIFSNSSSPTGILALNNDCLFIFYTIGGLFESDSKLFQFWINTRMIDEQETSLFLTKDQLDKACKDTTHTKYSENFKVELVFSNV